MAPATKKAKKTLPVAPQGGISKFFGAKDQVDPGVQEKADAAPVELKEAAAEPQQSKTEAEPPQTKTEPAISEEMRQLIEHKKSQAQAKKRARAAQEVAAETPKPGSTSSPEKATPSPISRLPMVVQTPEKPAPVKPAPVETTACRQLLQDEGVSKFGQLAVARWQQYNGLYAARLGQLKSAALEEARSIWSGMVAPECFMSDLSGYKKGINGREVVVAGVLFKQLMQRPNVIEEIRELQSSLGIPKVSATGESLCSDEDVIWLEENGMRVRLAAGVAEVARMATGFIVAVRGSATSDGHFKMSAFCFPRAAVTPAVQAPTGSVALMSGLAFGSDDAALAACRERALSFLQSAAVNRIVLCGGLFVPKDLDLASMKLAIKEADAFLARLGAIAVLDVMPGHHDPTNMALPQRPMHPQLFQNRGSFRSVSNPHAFEAGLSFTGHSGQPVEDLVRVSSLSPLESLVSCLEGRHLAPTAPDTLAIQAFADKDPFVLDAPPHVLFAGNCAKAKNLWRACPRGGSGTQCICVPAFHLYPAVVLVKADPRDVKVEYLGA